MDGAASAIKSSSPAAPTRSVRSAPAGSTRRRLDTKNMTTIAHTASGTSERQSGSCSRNSAAGAMATSAPSTSPTSPTTRAESQRSGVAASFTRRSAARPIRIASGGTHGRM